MALNNKIKGPFDGIIQGHRQTAGNVPLTNGPNRLRFVIPISSHVSILLGSFTSMPLIGLMAYLCMARNWLVKICFIKRSII